MQRLGTMLRGGARRLAVVASLSLLACGGAHGHLEAASGAVGSTNRQVIYRVPVEGFPTIGDDTALVTVVEFTDYECVYCAYAESTLVQLRTQYADDLRVVVIEHPMEMHPHARAAARAAIAADFQGHFDSMHVQLFRGSLEDESIVRDARDLGLDVPTFLADRADRAGAALERAEAVGKELGVPGTPAFFINGRMLVGPLPYTTFEAVVEERLAAAKRLLERGVRRQDVYRTTVANGLPHIVEAC
jgi:protein-disulfide isomerase